MRVSSRRAAVVCFAVLAGGCSAGDGQPSGADEQATGTVAAQTTTWAKLEAQARCSVRVEVAAQALAPAAPVA